MMTRLRDSAFLAGSWATVSTLCVLLLGVSACTRDTPPVSIASMQAEDAPDEESWDTVTHITDEGTPVLDMRAAYMARFEREEPTDSTYMVLSGLESSSERVRVDLYTETGDSSAVVFADQLTYYERERQFVARGNVIVTTQDGEHVEAEHLAWSESLKKIWTPGFARFRNGDDIWEGYNFEATDDLKEKHLENVTGVFHPDEE